MHIMHFDFMRGAPGWLSDLIFDVCPSREVAKKEGLADVGFRCELVQTLRDYRCCCVLLSVSFVLSWLCILHCSVVVNDGKAAGQTISYLHLHVIGGTQLSWPPI